MVQLTDDQTREPAFDVDRVGKVAAAVMTLARVHGITVARTAWPSCVPLFSIVGSRPNEWRRTQPDQPRFFHSPGPAAPSRVPLGARRRAARSQEPCPLRGTQGTWPLLWPRPTRRRRPAARDRLRPAATPDPVRPRSRHAGCAVSSGHPLVRPRPHPFIPTAPRRSAARKRSPGGRTAAPALCAPTHSVLNGASTVLCSTDREDALPFRKRQGRRALIARLTAGRKSSARSRRRLQRGRDRYLRCQSLSP